MKFNNKTNDQVKEIITQLSNEIPRRRIRVWYGDIKTGLSWNEEHDIMGYIGRSTGTDKIPLLVNNKRSFGGGGLLDHCIIRIDDIKAKKTLYKHEKFHVDLVLNNADKTIVMSQKKGIIARFNNEEKAQKYLNFMYGERYSK